MNFEKFTKKSIEAIQSAQYLAEQNRNPQIEQIHLLAALLQQEDGLAAQLLKNAGITVESLIAACNGEIQKLPSVSGGAGQLYLSLIHI